MLLRLLVHQFVRQAAEQKLHEVVSERRRQESGEPDDEQRGSGEQQRGGDEQESAGRRVSLPDCDIAVCFAVSLESGGFLDGIQRGATSYCASYVEHAGRYHDIPLIASESGEGRERAALAASDVIAIHKPQWVISAGFAAGLQPELRRGHVLMADQVIDPEGQRFLIGLKMDTDSLKSTPGVHVGALVTSDEILRSRDDKLALAEQTGGLACDLETSALAAICEKNGVRFLSVRIISEGLDDRLPPDVETLLGEKTLVRKMGAAAGVLWHKPSHLKSLWTLKEQAIKTSDRLGKFLQGVLPQLV